ncbi:MAG: polysaccharide biosynthesis/export family protein [Mucilaginibacter sp.]
MNFKFLYTIPLIAIIFISSCTPYKTVPYFQNLKRDSVNVAIEKISNFSPLTVQPGDLLAIHVNSLNHDADAQFNYNLERPNGINIGSSIGVSSENVVYGNLVDSNGEISLPMIGHVKVSNLTTATITDMLESKLSEYLTKPSINIRILNFKIAVLGDVSKPGSYDIVNEKITIPQALALAGDLNITGIRDNILLIREINGERQIITLSLSSKKIFDSPYYYLKNNDVIYVQPNKDKVAQSDSGLVKASLIISALSVLALILTKF